MKKFVLIALLSIPISTVSAYGVDTHARLTENAFTQYAKLRGVNVFTADDIATAAQGAVHEDEMRSNYLVSSRPLNHFYDPINNRGLVLAGTTYMASPIWAIDTKSQANYGYHSLAASDTLFSGDGDYSWNRSVYEYVYGDRTRALQGLGHVMHLVEDATSPAHTRNDPHPGGTNSDPYEDFTSGLVPHVALTTNDIPYFAKPEELIQSLALYTNTHFFSRDTVNEYEYPQKANLEYIELAGVGYGKNAESLVVQMQIKRNPITEIIKKIYLYPESDPIILTSNWNALSKKSVAYGVALIDLFMRDVAAEKETHALQNVNKSEIEIAALRDAKKLASGFAGVKSIYGSSLSYEDMEDLNQEQWNQNASVVSAYNQLTSPKLAVLEVPRDERVESQAPERAVTFEPLPNQQDAADVTTENVAEESSIPERDARTVIMLTTQPATVQHSAGAVDNSLPQPIVLSGSPGQGGGSPLQSEPPQPQNAATILTCTPPEVLNISGTACESPDTSSPTLDISLSGCLVVSTSGESTSCTAHTDAVVTLSWIAESGSVVTLDTITTTDTSVVLVAGAALQATDVSGNTTSRTIRVARTANPVIISEVGYPLANPQDATHQYIELYNTTDLEIDMSSLALESSETAGDPALPIFSLPLSGSIQPHSYFLITNAFDIQNVDEDMSSVWPHELQNTSSSPHQLRLVQASAVLDTFELSCPSLATACHPTGHPFALERSLRRSWSIDYAYANEQFNQLFTFSTADGVVKFVGSPKKRNTSDYVVSSLTGSLSAEYSPYYIPNLAIASDTTATIEPGVSLVFADGAGINVSGTFIINGTAVLPVNLSNPNRWNGITVSAGGNFSATHTSIATAGIGNSGSDNGAIRNRGGIVTIDNTNLIDVQPSGFFQDDGVATLTNVSISTSNYPESGVKVRGGTFTYTGGVLSNFSDFGFHITGTPTCSISNITITGVRAGRTSGSESLCVWDSVTHNGSPL